MHSFHARWVRAMVKTKECSLLIMAYPSSVDVSDDYIYVSDVVNIRLLRIEKRFKLNESVKL
jgi:hypothetical protein